MSPIVVRFTSILGVLGLSIAIAGAQAPNPTDVDRFAAKVVVQLLERNHMAQPRINDDIAVRWCKMFIKDLDPQKYNFLKADVDEFMNQATTLDDKIRAGDVSFAKLVFDRYLKRSDERLATVMELLKSKPDFSVDESIAEDPDKLEWPADKAEADERLRKRVKLRWLQSRIDKESDDEAIRKIRVEYRDRNRNFHQVSGSELLELYLSSLTRTFDPHSSYMSGHTYEDQIVQQLQKQSLIGIGASLQSEDGYPVVKELIPKGPADLDGRIQPEDKILGIIKPDGEEVSFVEKKLGDVVRLIRGEENTKVKLIIQPFDSKERKTYELVRKKVELTTERAKGQVIEAKADDKNYKLGVIHLPSFYGDSAARANQDPNALSATEDCRRLIKGFKDQGVSCLVMDLRGNGGGLLNEAITLSGLFIDTGPVLQVRSAMGVREIDDTEDGTAWDGPLVVLIDRQSASASEIFAGVVKDYDRGLLIGDASTFGKGTVQAIEMINEQVNQRNLPDLGALKLTIQQFYRANGESTQVRGVTPHVHIPSLFDQEDFTEGKLDNSMKFHKIREVEHAHYNMVAPELVRMLSDRSDARRKDNDKFKKRDEMIKKFIERRNRNEISLNETKYRAEIVSEDDEKKNQDPAKPGHARPKRFADRPVWDANYYNDEVVRIIKDYLSLGSKIFADAKPAVRERN